MVKRNLVRTQTGDNGIISYDMYWILSLVDYYMHSGDEATLASSASLVLTKLGVATAFWKTPQHQHFCGSDERIGADFNGLLPSNDEKSRYYKMLSVQAAREYANAVSMCGSGCSAEMKQAAASIDTTFTVFFVQERASTAPRWTGYEMHSAAGAIGTGLLTPEEETAFYYQLLNNTVHVCSFSPFNTYFVLFGLGRIRPPTNLISALPHTAGARSRSETGMEMQGEAPDPTASMRAALGMIRRCFHGMNRLGATTYVS